MYINLSKGKPWLSQLNNKISPMSTCNTTSAIMALMASGIEFVYPKDEYGQPEDYLTSLLHSDKAYHLMEKWYPWAIRGGYEPNEVHGMLQWGINILADKDVDTFSTNSSLSAIVNDVVMKRTASLVSGKFTKSGHIVCVVGIRSNQPVEVYHNLGLSKKDFVSFIVDDPYGNYHTGYQDRNGNNVEFSWDEFNELTKSSNAENSKWVHRFSV